MDNLLLAAVDKCYLWYTIPLIVTVSLVYSATRHEASGPILAHALRVAIWIVGFMAIVFVVLLILSWWTRG